MVSTMSSTSRTSDPSTCVDLAGHLLQDRIAIDTDGVRRTCPSVRASLRPLAAGGTVLTARQSRPGRPRPAAVRPAGAPRPARRRATVWSGARTSQRSGSTEDSGHVAPEPAAARRRPAAPGPRSRARAPKGGSSRADAQGPFGPGQQRRVGVRGGLQRPRGRESGSAPAPGRRDSRVPTSRAARASRASVSSPAPNRGASRCWSMSRKATTSARLDPVQGGLGPHHQPGSVGDRPAPRLPVISTASTPVSAESSSAARVTPIRSDLRRFESHTAHTAGRVSPHRRHSQPAAGLGLGHGPAAPGAAGQGPAPGSRPAGGSARSG